MKGLIRLQEERFAAKLLLWRFQKSGIEPPGPAELALRAEQLVDEAHRIGAERGKNVLSILKDLAASVRTK